MEADCRLVHSSKGGCDDTSQESRAGGFSHSHSAADSRQHRAGARLVQESARRRGDITRAVAGRQDHARGNPHRRLTHHANDEMGGGKSARAYGGSPASLWVYVDDCDTLFNRAISAGAKVHGPMGQLQDQFWGDRSGTFNDPYGYTWSIATRKEDLTRDEMERRGAEF